jgi:hypothetical protein
MFEDFGKVVENAKEMILNLADHVYSEETIREILQEAAELSDESSQSSAKSSSDYPDGYIKTAGQTVGKMGRFFTGMFVPKN